EQLRQILRCLPAGLADLRVLIHGNQCFFGAELGCPLPPGLQRLQLTGSLFYVPWSLQLSDTLSGCPALAHVELLAGTDDLLAALLSRLPRLRCLRFHDCSCLTRQAWVKLRNLPSFEAATPDLYEFWAIYCRKSVLTDEAVADLCASPVARGLRRLSLSDCSQLTAVALASIASGCPWLTELQLEGFRRVPRDERIEAAFEHRLCNCLSSALQLPPFSSASASLHGVSALWKRLIENNV
uniref:F-box domain-containing protein n=1 Tax=Macrostomum lignano TaxID=282301 RepID=A0A1I8G2G5_9PLAT